jgi:glycolate oxidase FAD binding subunit|tara:strand:+ start:1580 stop:2848 length:1269 start_codon:yes stop_codon:yes gene_type:complete
MEKNFQISQDFNDILKPNNEEEVSLIVKDLYKKNLPTEIIGSNSKNFIGNKLQCAKVLDLSKLSGIVEYLPEELYIKVKACTPIVEIEEILKKSNQQLAFEPIDFGYINSSKSNKGTAAGYLSCNFSGSRRFKSGSVRDHILGFRGVNGKGDIIKSGGTVVKNVTGYDLSKLITGSFGTLIALTELTFKVLPMKNSSGTLIIHEDNKDEIAKLFNNLLGSSNEISGSVFVPIEPSNKKFNKNREEIFKFNDLKYEGPFLAIRMEGSKKSIDERIRDLLIELNLKNKKKSILDLHQSLLFWEKINNLELFSNIKNSLVRVVVPPSKCINLMKYLDHDYKYYIDWCGSLFWIEVLDMNQEKLIIIKDYITNLGGYITVIKNSENSFPIQDIFTIDETRLYISKKIKESFDPKRIFNPGKMYKGI